MNTNAIIFKILSNGSTYVSYDVHDKKYQVLLQEKDHKTLHLNQKLGKTFITQSTHSLKYRKKFI